MAKKRVELDFIDIVMGANVDIIKQAYEARMKIDDQLSLREEAYRQIAELETKVEEIIGEPGEFIFPAPPLPVAGYSRLIPASRPAPKPFKATEVKTPAKTTGITKSNSEKTIEKDKPTEVKKSEKATK